MPHQNIYADKKYMSLNVLWTFGRDKFWYMSKLGEEQRNFKVRCPCAVHILTCKICYNRRSRLYLYWYPVTITICYCLFEFDSISCYWSCVCAFRSSSKIYQKTFLKSCTVTFLSFQLCNIDMQYHLWTSLFVL